MHAQRRWRRESVPGRVRLSEWLHGSEPERLGARRLDPEIAGDAPLPKLAVTWPTAPATLPRRISAQEPAPAYRPHQRRLAGLVRTRICKHLRRTRRGPLLQCPKNLPGPLLTIGMLADR